MDKITIPKVWVTSKNTMVLFIAIIELTLMQRNRRIAVTNLAVEWA